MEPPPINARRLVKQGWRGPTGACRDDDGVDLAFACLCTTSRDRLASKSELRRRPGPSHGVGCCSDRAVVKRWCSTLVGTALFTGALTTEKAGDERTLDGGGLAEATVRDRTRTTTTSSALVRGGVGE